MSAVSASPAALGSSPLDPVRALQHALYRAAKADPGRRFHATFLQSFPARPGIRRSASRRTPLMPHIVRQLQYDAPVPPLDAASAGTWTSDPWPQAEESNRRWIEGRSQAMPIDSVTLSDRHGP